VKRYQDIVGDGGSGILEQVAGQRARITDGLAEVRHLVAVSSGKGGVGKSTLTLHLAGVLRARGLRVAILDADLNGPSQARMAGVQETPFVPGTRKVALPRTRDGIAIFSMGSVIPESEALDFESAAHGESHTWRATKEFALLGEILGAFEWGALDLLMLDLPPGAERTVQYADFLRPFDAAHPSTSPGMTLSPSKGQGTPRVSFLLVTIPSAVARGVVARSVAALSKRPNRVLGYVENMSGYYCRDCDAIKPLFASPDPPPPVLPWSAGAAAKGPSLGIPCLGTVPFDPELARLCDRGTSLAEHSATPVGRALEQVAQQLLNSLESTSQPPLTRRAGDGQAGSLHAEGAMTSLAEASAEAARESRR
jgi:ATP-binding protein involved in chromosome partitioning